MPPPVQEFFERYASSRSAADVDRIVSQYADWCMLAASDGIRIAERKLLLAGFTTAMELLKKVGHSFTTLASLNETRLNEHYAMVRAQFVWRFEKTTAPPVDVTVDSTFILYLKDGVPEIVFHHEREDFFQALRTRGVLPEQP